ncbi:uncharacterized protein LOC144221929 [Crocuta crocuta]
MGGGLPAGCSEPEPAGVRKTGSLYGSSPETRTHRQIFQFLPLCLPSGAPASQERGRPASARLFQGPKPPGSYNGGRRAATLKSSRQEPAQRSSLCAQPPWNHLVRRDLACRKKTLN